MDVDAGTFVQLNYLHNNGAGMWSGAAGILDNSLLCCGNEHGLMTALKRALGKAALRWRVREF